MLERWKSWIAAFDQATVDDDWDRLKPYLCEDVVYAVHGVPFTCELRGRDAVLAGFAKSIRGFDRKLDRRMWHGVGVKASPTGAITGRAMGVYLRGDLPPLTFSASSQWLFRGDQISVMTDIYDLSEADSEAAMVWLTQHGQDLDASYV